MSNQKNTRPGGASAPSAGASRREALRQQQEAEAARQRRFRWIGIGAAVVALALIATVIGIAVHNHNKTQAASAASQVVPPHATDDKSGIVAFPGTAKEGVPTLVVYQDYQCPACKQAETQFGTIVNSLAQKGEVKLEYRTMTFLDTNLNNDSSQRSAIAAACADVVGSYAKYHDVVYAHQPTKEGQGYTDDQLRNSFAQEAGITGDNLTKFQQCYDQKATQDFVNGTNEAAGKAGIQQTPTYQVNGKNLDLQSVGTTEQSFLQAVQRVAAS